MSHYPYASGRQALANLTHDVHNRSNRQSPLCDMTSTSPTMPVNGIHVPDPAFAMPGYLQPHMFSGPQVSDPAMLMLGGSPLSGGNSPTFPHMPYQSPGMSAPGMLGSPQQAAALATAAAAAAGVQVPAQLSLADLELFTRMTTQIYQTMMSAQHAAYGGNSPMMPTFGSQPSFDAYPSEPQAAYSSAPLNSGAAPFVASGHSGSGAEFQSMLSTMLANGPTMFDPSHEPVVASEEAIQEMADRSAAIHGSADHTDKSPEAKAPAQAAAASPQFDSAIISAHVAGSEKSYADAVTPMGALKRFIAPASRATSTATVAAKKAPTAPSTSTGRSLSQASTVVQLFESARSPAPKSGSKGASRREEKAAAAGHAARSPPKKLRMDDDAPLDAAPCAQVDSQQYIEVELSRKQRVRVHATFSVNIGDAVVFEGDRGFEAGRCVGQLPEPSVDSATPTQRSRRMAPRVIRIANAAENALIDSLGVEGEKAVPVCQQAVDRLGLNLKVTDAQFQFDRKKLTFFYDAPDRVDFRDLLHEMYGTYKCRIWMARTEEKMLPSE